MVRAIRTISAESYAIAFIALVDLVVTILLVQGGHAREGNPIMRFYLSHGIPFLVLAKMLFTALPILILEWARRHRPDFVRRLSRLAIIGYVGFYGVLFAKVNIPTMLAQHHSPRHYWTEMSVKEAEVVSTAPWILEPTLAKRYASSD